MGVFDQLMAMLAEKQRREQSAGLIPSDFPSLGYNGQQPGQGPTPFRDPMQVGPEPPVSSPFAQAFDKKKAKVR